MTPDQLRGQLAPCDGDPEAHADLPPPGLDCLSVYSMLVFMRRQVPVGHVDADCFYVSAERVRYAHLAGMPVGVLGNQGACVIAKSYEMKAQGVEDRHADLGRAEALPRRALRQAGFPLVRGAVADDARGRARPLAEGRVLQHRRILLRGAAAAGRGLPGNSPTRSATGSWSGCACR